MDPKSVRTQEERLRKGPRVSGRVGTDLVQVDNTHSDFAQTLSPIDVGLGRPGDTTATEF